MANLCFLWDLEDDPDGNVQHIAEHGITQDEVEEVLRAGHGKAVASRSSGQLVTFGWTSTGKYIAVVFDYVDDDPPSVRPVTAFEAPPPATRKGKKRGR
ncbi:MAG: DUF4258 domain-containing protein [Gemmataceae bacterium]|nr:DUF4258 domain-containing protein [Gemmataceae bacterium]